MICSDIFSHVYVHVVFTCLWFMLNGLERFAIFCRGFYSITATQFMFGIWWPPMLHIFIIRCVFIVFIHGLFHFLVPFNVLLIFIYFHFLFIFISFHFLHFLLFFSLEKAITNLNTCMSTHDLVLLIKLIFHPKCRVAMAGTDHWKMNLDLFKKHNLKFKHPPVVQLGTWYLP